MGNMGFVMMLLAGVAIVGAIRYNTLRANWVDIIGVGGSYFILFGVVAFIMLAGALVSKLNGRSTGAESTTEVVIVVVIMLLSFAYTAFLMLVRCQSVSQRIMLPLVACLIGAGFCFRLLASIVLHIPMFSEADVETEEESGGGAAQFPQLIYDNDSQPWQLTSAGTDNATYYCPKTGESVTLHATELEYQASSRFHRSKG